jgi:ABC-2 type transport system ATP-binding protein
MLQIQNYKKTYSAAPVLSIAELELADGIYWLQGPNGSGKTTLLKSIAGLIPFEGSIAVKGLSLRKQRMEYTRQVSFAEAEPVYPFFLTGRELISFYLKTKGGNTNQAAGLANALGIAPFLANPVSSYSSGMLKKLSLLLSLMGDPSLILLDEPFITLDVNAVAVLQSLIETSVQKGISFLISTHQELALTVTFCTLQIEQRTLKCESNVAGA